jgi:transcriptional regulator with XRE-family HTH domain
MSIPLHVGGVNFNYMNFGKKLRELREEKNLTQGRVAKAVGVHQHYVSSWETGKSKPAMDNIIALAKLFHVSTDYLLTDNVPREGVEAINDFELYEYFKKTESLPPEKKQWIKGLVNSVVLAERIKEIPEWNERKLLEESTSDQPLRKVAGKR